jgi:hypothetical protein
MGPSVEYHGDKSATVWIDVDPVNGDDKNSGRKGEGPVKTLFRAKQLLSGLPCPDKNTDLW